MGSKRAFVALAVIGLALAMLGAIAQGRTGSLTTRFDSNSSAEGNTFDLSVLKRKGVVVRSLDVNVEPEGESGVLGVYTRPGTAEGFEDSPSGWTLRDSTSVTSEGEDQRTPAAVSFSLPRGEYGVAVGLLGDDPALGVEYTNTGGEDTFENDDLRLTSGSGLEAPLFEDTVYTPRVWNGTIHYSTPSCEFAKKKLKKAKKQVKRAKVALADAEAAGSPTAIAKAENKLEKKLKKKKRAKRVKKRACS